MKTRADLLRVSAAVCFCLVILAVHARAQQGPDTTPEIVAEAAAAAPAMPAGPVQATWDSIREHYQTPEWFRDARFGIFIHWGLYAVPRHGNE